MSGVSKTSSELGGALGIAVLGNIGSAVYRGQMTDAVPTGIPPHAAGAARDTLGGAVAVAGQLPDQLGAALLDTAREAFTQGVRLSFAISAVVAVGIAVLVAALLRRVSVGSESEQQPAPSQDGSGCASKVGVVKVSVTPPGRGPGLENTSARSPTTGSRR